MGPKRTFTLLAIVCVSALLFSIAQASTPKHAAKKPARSSDQQQIASAAPASAGLSASTEQGTNLAAAAVAEPTAMDPAELSERARNELYDKELELGKAEENKQVSFFQHNLTTNFMYVAFNGLVFSKDQLLQALSHVNLSNCEIRNVRFRRLDRNVVQLAYDLFVNGDIAGQAIPHQQYATSIWVKEEGNWMLAYHQTTPAHHR